MSLYNIPMNGQPPTLLIRTYQIAIGLKLLGAIVGIVTGYLLIWEWTFDRWVMEMITAIVLLLFIFPWPRGNRLHLLIIALALGILAPNVDLIYSIWVPFEPLASNPYHVAIGWTFQEINGIFSLGQLFMMVPVVLASWQFGTRGFMGALALAGLAYIITPFLLPNDAFIWGIYAIRGFVLLGVTLILGFTVGALATAQRQANADLSEANRKLAAQAITMEQLATSRERNRLARELHDTLAHSLSGTAVSLQAIGTLLKHNPDAAAQELTSTQNQIRVGLVEARRAIGALRTSALDEIGLADALQQRAESISQRTGLQLDCIIDPLPPLPPTVEQTIYRIADEAMRNVEKHAQAITLSLTLRHNNGALVLCVQDDGQGFVVEEGGANGRYGLVGMKERAALVSGALLVESKLNQGTLVQLSVNSEQ